MIDKSVAVCPYIIFVDKQGIIPCNDAVFDICKRFWITSQKHLFFSSQFTGGSITSSSNYYRLCMLINLPRKFSKVQRLGLQEHWTQTHNTGCAASHGKSKCSNSTCRQHLHSRLWMQIHCLMDMLFWQSGIRIVNCHLFLFNKCKLYVYQRRYLLLTYKRLL